MSDLTEAHRRTFQSLAKAINSLHKRKWIDDEKREHYRRILKAMAADEENYNQDTVDRLKKKLDRVKKKMTVASASASASGGGAPSGSSATSTRSNDGSKSTSTEKTKSKKSSNKAANANIRQPFRNTESSKTNEADRLDVIIEFRIVHTKKQSSRQILNCNAAIFYKNIYHPVTGFL